MLELVTLVVHEYDDAISFFCDVLDFRLTEDSPSFTNDGRAKRWVVVTPAQGGTGLLLAKADKPEQLEVIGNQHGGRVGFFLRVPDFGKIYQQLLTNQIEVIGEPRFEPYGEIVVFKDIFGNRWDLLGPPGPVDLSETALTIRQAKQTDAPILAEAERRIAQEPGLLVSTPGELKDEDFAAKIRSLRDSGVYLVAELEGQIVGHILLDPLGKQQLQHILRLTICAHRNGLGIGTQLLAAAIEKARHQGFEKIELCVRADNNKAIKLYRKFGFTEEGRHRNRLKCKDGYRDDLSMALWLPSNP